VEAEYTAIESKKLNTPIQTCTECHDKGIVLSTVDRCITAQSCPSCTIDWEVKQRRDRDADLINYAQIPSGFMSAMLENEIPTFVEDWYSDVSSGSKKTNQSLFLCGPSGSGKTFAAITLIFRFAQLGKSVRYIDCSEYLMDRRASYSARNIGNIGDNYTKKTENDRWSIARYEIVILDNIGVGTSNDWTKEQYDHLIDARQTSGKSTIYISNYADDPQFTIEGKKLTSLIGQRAANRISQSAMLYLKERTTQSSVPPAMVFEPVKPPRPLAPNETTFLHIWAREGLFSMVSKKERSTLTAKSKVNPKELIELPYPQPREYISWTGIHVLLQGPVVDYEDANVLAALMKIYHKIGVAGIVTTTLANILRELGLDADSGAKLKQLKRSLVRLAESRITMRSVPNDPKIKSEEMMWIGGFLDSVAYDGSTKSRKVIIKFNDAMAPFYEKKSLVLLPLDTLTSLSSYAQGIYRFLLGHRDSYKFISLPRWREILAINPTVQEKSYKDCMRLAIKELIAKNLLTEQSNIDSNGIVHSYIVRATTEQIH
jgi:DNA replication protein DnaC